MSTKTIYLAVYTDGLDLNNRCMRVTSQMAMSPIKKDHNFRIIDSEAIQIEPEEISEKICNESDGCPTELAVLQRFWREHPITDGIEQEKILQEALMLMDGARNILTSNEPADKCNWGMLDTKYLRERLSTAPIADGSGREWQPIKTIPIDQYVDVWVSIPSSNCGGVRLTECAFLSNGIWSGRVREYPLGNGSCDVTHWMPLPTPPQSDAHGSE